MSALNMDRRRPVLVNDIAGRQVLGYFHGWNADWIGRIEDPFSGRMFMAGIRDIVFMDNEPYARRIWEYIYKENLRLMEEA